MWFLFLDEIFMALFEEDYHKDIQVDKLLNSIDEIVEQKEE